ncbi:MAG: hypothetical protein ACK4YQ_10935 [Phenylobacterium sp.]|uniref:hypothetical protein n=1 Tax=Phenylobacterium sp. TaxID=1871053 RepID=UPI00391A11DF
MDIAEFKARLEELGADLSRWPAADEEAALELIAASVEAQDLFAHAAADDLALEGEDVARVQALVARAKDRLGRGE